MDFSIPSQLSELQHQIREFVHTELYPLEPRLSNTPFHELQCDLEKTRQRVRERGWWLPQVPRTHGGMGLSLTEYSLIAEELGRSPLGHYAFNAQAPDAGNIELLLEFGSEEQKSRWLTPLLRGEVRSCFSMTERDYPGSNPVWMATRADRDGDDYVINGHKWFTTAADGASFAIVMAITNPHAAPHERASQILVPTETAGFEIVRNIPCMGHAGDGWMSHSEIRYVDCRVPVANRLGPEGSGFLLAQARLGPGRIHHCMRWIGVAERSLDLLCHHATQRLLSPDQSLGQQQTIHNWIADSRAEINAARWMTLHAAWKIDAQGTRAARAEISMIKFYVAQVMTQVIDRAIQVHGALGISDDTILSHFYRHERAAHIYDGPDEVHRSVVAKSVLRDFAK